MAIRYKIFRVQLLISIALLFISCSNTDNELEYALSLAGSNRAELEYVLTHYRNENNSLKLKAAEFLIRNIPDHVHYEIDSLDLLIHKMYKIAVENNVIAGIAVDSVEQIHGKLFELPITLKYDIKIITADQIIKNIDYSFKAWEESSWYNDISFERFCREILPYKISDEPFDNWREEYYKAFKPVLDSLHHDNSYFTACQILYDALMQEKWFFTGKIQTPGIKASTLLHNRIGGCNTQAHFVTYAMRALAIPVGIDMTIQSPRGRNNGHVWNYIYDEKGNLIEFILEDPWRPELGVRDTLRKKGAIYRLNFEKQDSSLYSLYPDEEIPVTLSNSFLSDVSSSYFPFNSLEIPIETPKEKLAFLCTFNNTAWVPIKGSPIANNKVTFEGVEPNIMYCGAYYKNDEAINITAPFYIEENNKIHYLVPDTNNVLKEVYLKRKYPISHTLEEYRKRSVNGKFQISNDANFKFYETLFEIKEPLQLRWYEINLDREIKGRYARYLSADSGYCNMAEVKFFHFGRHLEGKVIGTDEFTPNDRSIRNKSAIFDNDPLTFFDASAPSGSWAGLDFGKLTRINKIEFLFRNDDNMIREGDLYELFYFSGNNKISLGQQKGTKNGILIYRNVPGNCLFLLRNYTRGKEERIFTYANGEQIWW